MRRGFLNNTKAKPKYDRTSAKALPPVLDESQSITQPPNSGDPTLDDKDARNWAERLGLSLDEFYKLAEKQAARRRQPFETIFRNFMFERFQGVTYTDSTILNLLQVEYGALLPALRGAYRISAVRGKGLGMFAARDIPAGAVIVCENPVIVVPAIIPVAGASKVEMWEMLFDRLDPPERDRALSLANCKPAEVCGKKEGILRTNGMGLELPVPDTPTAPDPTHIGIFLDMSRCNHSCDPNAGQGWDVMSYSMSLYALRPIPAGEEITFTYTTLTDARDTRRARLMNAYRFHCECPRCQVPDDVLTDGVPMEAP